jgi:hypothetical protein
MNLLQVCCNIDTNLQQFWHEFAAKLLQHYKFALIIAATSFISSTPTLPNHSKTSYDVLMLIHRLIDELAHNTSQSRWEVENTHQLTNVAIYRLDLA